jgi:hypothetical protein
MMPDALALGPVIGILPILTKGPIPACKEART